MKYTTALRLGTAEAEQVLRRFTRGDPKHPTYQEIHEGLQVVENWNSANKDLFYGKDGDLAGQGKESQEVSMLALHLLQSALVHVTTLLMQQILADPKWADTLTDADRRALSPLFWTHMNPYGRFISVGRSGPYARGGTAGRVQSWVSPPSTASSMPVVYVASKARNAAALANSSTVP